MEPYQEAAVKINNVEIVKCIETNIQNALIDFTENGIRNSEMCVFTRHDMQIVERKEKSDYGKATELIHLLKNRENGFKALTAALKCYGRPGLAAKLEEESSNRVTNYAMKECSSASVDSVDKMCTERSTRSQKHNIAANAVPIVIQGPNNTSFRILQHVGSGTYGHVFLAQFQETGLRGALKIVPAVANEDTELPYIADRHVRRECSFHTYLDMTQTNPQHVVKAINGWKMEGFTKQEYLNWYQQNVKHLVPTPDTATYRLDFCLTDDVLLNIYFIFMPYYEMGNLKTWLNKNPKFSVDAYEQRLSLFRDILSGVKFMHKKGVFHRRLCSDNILLEDDGHSRIRAVIGGLGRITSSGEHSEWPLSKTNRNVSRRSDILGANTEAFRELFEAPEVKGTDYDKGCDHYSIGVIALQLFWNLHKHNDLFDAIYCLQNDGTIGTKQDNPNLPKKEFWLDVVSKQVSRKREQRYSCSYLLQMCEGLKDHEIQDVECDSEVCQTLESTSNESPALFNIASAENRPSVSSISTSSSTASLPPSSSALERPLSSDELTKWSLSHDSCYTATQAKNSAELNNINSSNTTTETNGPTNINPSNVKSSEMTNDRTEASEKDESGVPAYFQTMTLKQQSLFLHKISSFLQLGTCIYFKNKKFMQFWMIIGSLFLIT